VLRGDNLGAAPPHGATTRADLRATGLLTSVDSVEAGQSLAVFGRIANRAGRRTTSGRATFSLRTSRTARSGKALGSLTIKRTKGGSGRLFRVPVVIAKAQPAGRYRVFICVSQPGRKRAKCTSRAITVRAAPATPAPPAAAPDTRNPAEKLRDAVADPGMMKHLQAFQDIANANGGNRASGFPGYNASAAYVMEQLAGAGYSPTAQAFDFVVFTEVTPPVFQQTAPTPTTYEAPGDGDDSDEEFASMSYSDSGDATAALEAVDVNLNPVPAQRTSTSGCEPGDFSAFEAGKVALIQRGTCDFAVKAVNAQNAGAVAVVIFNQGNDPGRTGVVAGTLGETAQDGDPAPDDVTIPVIGTSYALGEQLATASGVSVRVKVDATNIERSTLNVLADTPTGNPNTTIVQGSHLDSVQAGPGINDDGSGSAYNLETALQIAKTGFKPANRIRFAFWGAEESGLVGSTRYVAAISDEEFAKIKMNLNHDMLASPNFARLIYDGDFSDSPPPATAPDVNAGADEIEDRFKAYFDSKGLATKPTAFDGRSDYKPFQDNGVAAGGLFTGAEVSKSQADQALFGGISNVAFDPNYHGAGDTVANINQTGYEQMTDAAAYVLAWYATDPGFPVRFEAAQSGFRARPGVKSERLGASSQR
jgi:Zn-dependent M28 family amino/carboxypeptidase